MSKELITFQPQPDFPIEDITESNAAMAETYMKMTKDSEIYTQQYQNNLMVMHEIGNSALIGAQINPGNNKAEYRAFCHGFTLVDYLAVLLDSRPHSQLQDGQSMDRLFIKHGEMVDFEVWQRRQMWLETHQNTAEIMRSVSDRRSETPKQFAARAMGAQIASEILY